MSRAVCRARKYSSARTRSSLQSSLKPSITMLGASLQEEEEEEEEGRRGGGGEGGRGGILVGLVQSAKLGQFFFLNS